MRALRVVAVGLALVACSSGVGEPFAEDDLPRIALRADEAPEGTRKVAELGGAQDLESFATSPVEREALVADGFVQGYVVYFAPDTYFAVSRPSEQELEAAVSVQVIAGLFGAVEGARSSLDRYVEDLSTRQVPGRRPSR